MYQGQSMALSGNAGRPRSWLRLDWASAYGYVVLCFGCYASYLGAPPLSIIATSALLALPHVVRFRGQNTSTIEIGAHVVVALIFALLAHIVGWGIAGVLGT
jgi:hypothetical protein